MMKTSAGASSVLTLSTRGYHGYGSLQMQTIDRIFTNKCYQNCQQILELHEYLDAPYKYIEISTNMSGIVL